MTLANLSSVRRFVPFSLSQHHEMIVDKRLSNESLLTLMSVDSDIG